MNSGGYVAARVDGEPGVRRVLEGLKDAGVPRRNVEVLSEVPLPETVTLGPMRESHLLRFTLAGGLTGLAIGVFLAVIAPALYPLIVGGQPPVAVTSLVILYEITMFGIVLATAAGFVYEMRPWRTVKRPYWSGVAQGDTYVVVEPPPDFVASRIAGVLETHGGRLVDLEEAAG